MPESGRRVGADFVEQCRRFEVGRLEERRHRIGGKERATKVRKSRFVDQFGWNFAPVRFNSFQRINSVK